MPILHDSDDGLTTGATKVTVVSAPASSAQRIIPVGGLSIYNADTVTTNDVFIQKLNNASTRIIEKSTSVGVSATVTNSTVINLSATNQSLEIVLSNAKTTNELHWVVSYMEIT